MAMVSVACHAAAGSIRGSAHDFTISNWANSVNGDFCVTCHDQSVSGGESAAGVQWNHASSVANYVTYSSFAHKDTAAQPGALSKLCLSCHDGTVALDAFGDSMGTGQFISTTNSIGTNLSNSHPVGIYYDTGRDSTLVDPRTSIGIPGCKPSNDCSLSSMMLYNGQLECPSCHDVHNKNTPPNERGLLKESATGSKICKVCHSK